MTTIRAALCLFGVCMLTVIDIGEAFAETYRPWCAVYSGRGGRNCGFVSFEQCMHVRFSGTMLVSPSSTPKDDVFERKDNYYVYLKPFDIADEVVLKRMRFSGKPPVWIPMPPH